MKASLHAFLCLLAAAPIAGCEKKRTAETPAAAVAPKPVQVPSAPEGQGPAAAPVLDANAGVVGGLRLGMSRADAQRVMPLSAHPSGQMGDNVAVSGPYSLMFDAKNALASIEYNVSQSGAGVRIGAANFPATADRAALANALGGCAKPEATQGGEQTVCAGRRAMIKVARSCAKKDVRGACAEWTNEKQDVLVQVSAP